MTQADDGRIVQAEEAAAWVTGYPQYDREWPRCEGKCARGTCALASTQAACCYFPQSHRSERFNDERYYDDRGRPYAKGEISDTVAAAKPAEQATTSGYWRSKNWYCWR